MNLTNGKYAHISSSIVTITPKMAEEYLNKNPVNRPLKPGAVEKIARDIISDNWIVDGHAVTLAKDGEILNGQHVLWACVEAKKPIVTLLVTGVDKDAIRVIDSGTARTWADQHIINSKLEGKSVMYVANLQAVLKNIHWYETAWPTLQTGGKKNASFAELNSILSRHPTIEEAIQHVCSGALLKNLGGSSVCSTVYGLAMEKYPNEARGWLEILKAGSTETPNNPAHVLREKLIARNLTNVAKLDVNTKFVYFIKSWNAYIQGDEIAGLRWGKDEPMPAIFGTPQYTGKMAAHTALLKRAAVAPTPQAKAATKVTGRKKTRSTK